MRILNAGLFQFKDMLLYLFNNEYNSKHYSGFFIPDQGKPFGYSKRGPPNGLPWSISYK